MQLEGQEIKPIINRLKRAQGQLNAVTRMMEEGAECEDVVVQLAAVSKALDRAGFSIIATGLKQCTTTEEPEIDQKKLEKMFLSLA